MGRSAGNLIVVLAVSIMTVLAGAAGAGLPMQEPQVNPNAEAMAAFKARVDDYMKLHRKAASDAPSLPDGATPEQIDRHQRDLAARIAAAREGARQGEVFDAPIRRVVNEVMSEIFSDPQRRREFRDAVLEENPEGVTIRVNARYPDGVPLATMPPDLLEVLPALPVELEYRFVGEALILLDTVAHIVVDYIPDVLPGA